MKKLNYELKNLAAKNKNGSHSTQADRRRYLQLIANQLERLGFKHMGVNSLKPKHVWKLVRYWQTEVSTHTGRFISNGTIKNRMTVLRWWATKIDKAKIEFASLFRTKRSRWAINKKTIYQNISNWVCDFNRNSDYVEKSRLSLISRRLNMKHTSN